MKLAVTVLAAFLVLAAIALLSALPTMWLWNYLMPALFGLKTITFVQALCLNALCSLLFKSTVSGKS